MKARIATAFLALQAATDFGGTVDYSEVVATIRTTDGVLHLALVSPAADVVLDASQLAVMVDALTYQEV
jgi:phage-related baseplate assembly protein